MEACTIKQLPADLHISAAEIAVETNPLNRPSPAKVMRAGVEPTPQRLAILTSKRWPATGVKLGVTFLDGGGAELQAKILAYANKWGKFCNVKFTPSTQGEVRITRTPGQGYYSYLGTDILSIRGNTMNLDSFSLSKPDSEFDRVVCHEFGHSLGFGHEHMRAELVNRLDRQKTIAYFQQTQGWSAQETQQQVLTPLSEASIRGTPHADQDSIMCYQLPAAITVDGQPIHGGMVIDENDAAFAATCYPLPTPPAPPPVKPPEPEPKPPTNGGTSVLAKILALIAALRAGDFATLLKILGELLAAKQAGQLSDAEFAECEKALAPKK